MFLHKRKNNCHITFPHWSYNFITVISGHFSWFVHTTVQKKTATPCFHMFSSVFEDVRYPFVFVAFSLRQNAATCFFCDWFFRLIFSGHCFHFLRTCSNVQKNAATPFVPYCFENVNCCLFSFVYIFAEMRCNKKTRLHFCGAKCEKMCGSFMVILCFRASMKITGK